MLSLYTRFYIAICDFPRLLPAHVNRYWRLYTFAPAGLLLAMTLIGHSYTLAVNISPSLPYKLFLVHKGEPVHRGDFVAFHWHGGGHYDAGVPFCKIAAGVPGDRVERHGRDFFVNGRFVGHAKPIALSGDALEMTEPRVIGKDEYYMMASHPDSLDSRYKLAGYITAGELIGRAYAIF